VANHRLILLPSPFLIKTPVLKELLIDKWAVLIIGEVFLDTIRSIDQEFFIIGIASVFGK